VADRAEDVEEAAATRHPRTLDLATIHVKG